MKTSINTICLFFSGPKKISDEIYADLRTLHSRDAISDMQSTSSTTDEQLYRPSEVCDNIVNSRTEKFNSTLGNINTRIIVS